MSVSIHPSPSILLASNSPRRKELLAQLGYVFISNGSDIDESVNVNESAVEYVKRMAVQKALVQANDENTVVIGSDTSVVCGDEILGKPKDYDDAKRMLEMLSDNTHQVLTSIAVVKGADVSVRVVTTDVTFKTLTDSEILNYWQTGEPKDKAGSYGIQGIAGQFVTCIKGSYSAVVGLPLYETAQLLAKHGCPTVVMQS